MTDFGPMIANPSLVILGAAAHLGIFIALIGANLFGFSLAEALSASSAALTALWPSTPP